MPAGGRARTDANPEGTGTPRRRSSLFKLSGTPVGGRCAERTPEKLSCPVRGVVALFGTASYLYFFWVFLAWVSWLVNGAIRVSAVAPYFPYTIDGPAHIPLTSDTTIAFFIDLGLLLLWVLHHIAFTNALDWGYTQLFKFLGDAQRAFDVLISSAFMQLLFVYWQPFPIDGAIYRLSPPYSYVLLGLYFFGVLFTLISTFALEHFELFGLRQSLDIDFMAKVGIQSCISRYCVPVTDKGLCVRWTYHVTRNPVFTGFLMMMWFAESLTYQRLLFNCVWSAFILIDTPYVVEPGRQREIGDEYEDYMAKTPMLCPFSKCGTKAKARCPVMGQPTENTDYVAM